MSDDTQPIAVLAVGHCGPDTWMLRTTVEKALGARARFEGLDEEKALRSRLETSAEATLLLVNRRLDGWFDAPDGIALIGELLDAGHPRLAAMLISNLPDALAAAEAAGAMPGFGKTALHAPATLDTLRAAADHLNRIDRIDRIDEPPPEA
jgi:hypothetical protein